MSSFPLFSELRIIYIDGDILIYTEDFYEANKTIFGSIGHQTSATAFINDVKIESPVFHNRNSQSNFGDFILLIPALEALNAEITFRDPNTIIARTDTLRRVVFRADATVDTANNTIREFRNGTGGCFIVDGEIYIEIWGISAATDGSLRQDEGEELHVFTSDYVRQDIPTSLEDAFRILDELIGPEGIEELRNIDSDELVGLTHFGLGLWIRNNWIYPGFNNSFFRQLRSLSHPDSASSFIVEGYHRYLTDEDFSADDYMNRLRMESLRVLSLPLIFMLIIAATRYFLRKLPRPVRIFEKIGCLKYLRVPIVLCVSSLLISGVSMLLPHFRPYVIECAFVIILGLAMAFAALFCFVDMTKRQIAISAILPTVLYIALELVTYYYVVDIPLYIIWSWGGWSLIFTHEYIHLFRSAINLFLPWWFSSILVFLPFIYVLLARSKMVSALDETKEVVKLI